MCSIIRVYLNPLIRNASNLLSMPRVSCSVLEPHVSCATTIAFDTQGFYLYEQLVLYQQALNLFSVNSAFLTRSSNYTHPPASLLLLLDVYLGSFFHGLTTAEMYVHLTTHPCEILFAIG